MQRPLQIQMNSSCISVLPASITEQMVEHYNKKKEYGIYARKTQSTSHKRLYMLQIFRS